MKKLKQFWKWLTTFECERCGRTSSAVSDVAGICGPCVEACIKGIAERHVTNEERDQINAVKKAIKELKSEGFSFR